MFTPTVGEIDTAIRTNNRKEAVAMLQQLMQDKPGADAWYLAAKLTNDRQKKIQYLQTAVVIEPNHRKSLDYLQELGGTKSNFASVLLNNVLGGFQDQVSSSVLLRNLSPKVQMTIGASIVIFLLMIVVFVLANLLSLRGPSVSTDGPTKPAIGYLNQADVLGYVNNSDLDILYIEQNRDNSVGKDIIQLDIRDVGNHSREVTIFVYDGVSSILADQNTLDISGQAFDTFVYSNVVAMYPLELSETAIAEISDIFEIMKNNPVAVE